MSCKKLCFSNSFQRNSGIEFDSSLGSFLEIDLSGMSPCLTTLRPEHCVNGGATYMFWMKPTDSQGEKILTTMENEFFEGLKLKVGSNVL